MHEVKRKHKVVEQGEASIKEESHFVTEEENSQEKLLMKNMILKSKTFKGLVPADSQYRGKTVNDQIARIINHHNRGCTKLQLSIHQRDI